MGVAFDMHKFTIANLLEKTLGMVADDKTDEAGVLMVDKQACELQYIHNYLCASRAVSISLVMRHISLC